MAELFDAEWMTGFQNAWNGEPELADALAKIDFNSTIGYGFPDDPTPKGVIVVEKGKVVSAGAFNGETLSWDLRAKPEVWTEWMSKPPGMAGLGMAVTTGKLKFKQGDYKAMIKDPRMAGPFIKSFAAMGKAVA